MVNAALELVLKADLASGMPFSYESSRRMWMTIVWLGMSVELQDYINRQIREEDHHYWNKAVFSGVQLF